MSVYIKILPKKHLAFPQAPYNQGLYLDFIKYYSKFCYCNNCTLLSAPHPRCALNVLQGTKQK